MIFLDGSQGIVDNKKACAPPSTTSSRKKFEAGVALLGQEVKAVRRPRASKEAYVVKGR
jgi:tmRNA-binding protein